MIELPKVCPVCGHKLEWKGVDLVCVNKDCDNIKEQDLKVWTDVISPVDGLAWLTKKKYFEQLKIKSIEDLEDYICNKFDKDEEAGVYSSITDKKFSTMINLITYAEVPLEVGLKALNIERLGTESAKKIAEDENAYNFIMLLINNDFPTDYSFEDIEKVVGPATTSTIIENKDKLKRLRYIHILPFVKKTIVNTVGTFCVTGKLNRMKRNDLIKLAEEKGWKSLSGVNKDCNYLVTNDTTSGSSKNKKAQELGTKIIDEEAFYNLLGI